MQTTYQRWSRICLITMAMMLTYFFVESNWMIDYALNGGFCVLNDLFISALLVDSHKFLGHLEDTINKFTISNRAIESMRILFCGHRIGGCR